MAAHTLCHRVTAGFVSADERTCASRDAMSELPATALVLAHSAFVEIALAVRDGTFVRLVAHQLCGAAHSSTRLVNGAFVRDADERSSALRRRDSRRVEMQASTLVHCATTL